MAFLVKLLRLLFESAEEKRIREFVDESLDPAAGLLLEEKETEPPPPKNRRGNTKCPRKKFAMKRRGWSGRSSAHVLK